MDELRIRVKLEIRLSLKLQFMAIGRRTITDVIIMFVCNDI